MREFFIPSKTLDLMFTPLHWFVLLITICMAIYIILKKDTIRNLSKKHQSIISKSMAFFLFMNMTLYYGSYIYYGYYDFKYHLPLHFCFITGYLWMYSIVFNKKSNLPFLFLFVFMGAIPAMIFWDVHDGFNKFIIYQFTISHNVFILFSIFLFIMFELKITKKDIIKGVIISNIIFFTMLVFNLYFNTNYIFSTSYPKYILNLYPFLHFIHPIIMVELLAYSMMAIAYYVAKLINSDFHLYELIQTIYFELKDRLTSHFQTLLNKIS